MGRTQKAMSHSTLAEDAHARPTDHVEHRVAEQEDHRDDEDREHTAGKNQGMASSAPTIGGSRVQVTPVDSMRRTCGPGLIPGG
jgi:hypothetical protein